MSFVKLVLALVLSTMLPADIPVVDRGFVAPVGEIIVVNYFNPPPRPWDSGFHRGVDLLASPDDVIVAPGAGVISYARSAFGKPVVSIVHPSGLISSLEPVIATVAEGDAVAAGTPIGTLGYWPELTGSNATHCPAATCVHWGVRRSEDNYLDPLWLLGLAAPIVLLPTM